MTETTVNALLARLKRARKVGSGWIALCPCHPDQHPSLSVFPWNGRWFAKCHACSAGTQDLLAAAGLAGRREGRIFGLPRSDPNEIERVERRRKAAHRLWLASLPLSNRGSLPVANYLSARGILFDHDYELPGTLRFHPACPHPTAGKHSALIAAVQDRSGRFVGVHRTYLSSNGSSKADVETQKASLGPIAGGMVRLSPLRPTLCIGEGIETVLSVMVALAGNARLGDYSYAAALSTSGIRALEIPAEVCQLIVLADRDQAGEQAARVLAQKALREGRTARIARPGETANDFNDLLMV